MSEMFTHKRLTNVPYLLFEVMGRDIAQKRVMLKQGFDI